MPLSERYQHQVALLIETLPFVAASFQIPRRLSHRGPSITHPAALMERQSFPQSDGSRSILIGCVPQIAKSL